MRQIVDLPFVMLANAEATHRLGYDLGRSLPAGSNLLLQGDLGSGKTSLVQGIGAGLGIADLIVSPTFTLVSDYCEGRIPLYHFDLYRLEPTEVQSLYIHRYWDDWEIEPGIVAIEWPERLPIRPDAYIHFQLIDAVEQGRCVHVSTQGLTPEAIARLKSVLEPFQARSDHRPVKQN
jgi:tRNA threonylcarbamoyladenosine biosynthesis protein TsaE